jgi:hypothetical protein
MKLDKSAEIIFDWKKLGFVPFIEFEIEAVTRPNVRCRGTTCDFYFSRSNTDWLLHLPDAQLVWIRNVETSAVHVSNSHSMMTFDGNKSEIQLNRSNGRTCRRLQRFLKSDSETQIILLAGHQASSTKYSFYHL